MTDGKALTALAAVSGSVLWTVGTEFTSLASAGGLLAVGGHRTVALYEAASGKELWRKALTDYSRARVAMTAERVFAAEWGNPGGTIGTRPGREVGPGGNSFVPAVRSNCCPGLQAFTGSSRRWHRGDVIMLDMEGNIAVAGWENTEQTGYGLQTTWEGEAWMPRLAAFIRNQAGIDPLTGLDARPRFESRVVQELKRAARSKHPTAVAVIEMEARTRDRDDVGCMMVQAAAILGRELRDLDSLARIDDSCFAALLPMCDSPSAAHAVERALVALRGIPGVTVTAGVASTAETTGWDIIEAACASLPRGSACVQSPDRLVRAVG